MCTKLNNAVRVALAFSLPFASVALASGPRSPAGYVVIPAMGQIRQFDSKKIEVKYQRWVLILDRSYSGLPSNLEPRPDNPIELRLTAGDLIKVVEKTKDQPDTKPIDLRGILK